MHSEPSNRSPRMARASASILAADLTAGILAFAFVLIVARVSGPTVRGTLAFVTTAPVLLAYAGTLGLEAANLYFGGRDPSRRSELVSVSVTAGIATATLLAAGAFVVFRLQPEWVPGTVQSGALIAGLASTALVAVQVLLDAALIGSGQIASANAIRIAMPATSVILFGLAATTGNATATSAIAAWVVGRVVGFVTAVGVATRRLGAAPPSVVARSLRDFLRFGLPVHVGNLADIPIRRLDTLVLGASRGATELGIYQVAVNLAEVMMYLPSAISSVLLPAGAARPTAATRSLTRQALMITAAVLATVALVTLAVASPVVRAIFGDAFSASAGPLRILALAMIGIGGRMVLRAGLIAQRRQALSSALTVATLVLIVVLDVTLIPRYGATGAAWASAIAYLAGAAVMLIAFLRLGRREPSPPLVTDAQAAWSSLMSLLRRPP